MQQEFITVTFNRTKIAIRCADILYVIMSDDHCTIHMFDGSVYRCRMTLKALKKQLNEGFMEVKRGCMIAVSAISNIGDKILLSNGSFSSVAKASFPYRKIQSTAFFSSLNTISMSVNAMGRYSKEL